MASIAGDCTGLDICRATMTVAEATIQKVAGCTLEAGEKGKFEQFSEVAQEIFPGGLEKVGKAETIALGAFALLSAWHENGKVICSCLRFRVRFGLCVGVRPQTACLNAPVWLADPLAVAAIERPHVPMVREVAV